MNILLQFTNKGAKEEFKRYKQDHAKKSFIIKLVMLGIISLLMTIINLVRLLDLEYNIINLT